MKLITKKGLLLKMQWFGLLLLVSPLMVMSGCGNNAPEWTQNQWKIIQSLSLSSPLIEPDRLASNQYLNNAEAAALGKQLFFDTQLSASKSISCASCHQPDKYFTDGKKTAQGINELTRNTPSIIGLSKQTWLYWDGRKDSLWSQALAPLEAAKEMNTSRLEVVRTIGKNAAYRRSYTKIFGEFPFQLLRSDMPLCASPVGNRQCQDNWYRFSDGLKKEINQVFSNIGKALAAFEATLNFKEAKFDRYVKALKNNNYKQANAILNVEERAGLALFIDQEKTRCLQCHNGPFLSNGDFHNINTGSFEGDSIDFGRFLGLQSVLIDEFNCLGFYSDAKSEECVHLEFLNKQIHGSMRGAFRTPSLRNAVNTAPYFHDGRYENLQAVLMHYMLKLGADAEINPIVLSEKEQQQLLMFIKSLSE